MKVGVLQFFSWSRRIPLETVYERAFERIAILSGLRAMSGRRGRKYSVLHEEDAMRKV